MSDLEDEIRSLNKRRVWTYKPQLNWYGWATLLPTYRGHDEYSRETWVIGWSITGQIVIADKNPCGDEDCYQQTLRYIEESFA